MDVFIAVFVLGSGFVKKIATSLYSKPIIMQSNLNNLLLGVL
jgi:hypothetical protein